jgi:hypothetical protein
VSILASNRNRLDIGETGVKTSVHAASFAAKEEHMKTSKFIIRSTIALAVVVALTNHMVAAENAFPGTEAGATSLLNEFVKPGANHAALSKQLRPTAADYAAVFEPDLAAKMEPMYGPAWDAGQLVIAPKAGQSEVKVVSATSEQLKSGAGAALDFPGGWKDAATKLKPGLKIYRFKFVEPGKDLGMAFDGLVYVNGNWRIFPKPWRAMEK